MVMNLTEQFLARSAGKSRVSPGDIVTIKPDVMMGNDVTTAVTVRILNESGLDTFADKNKMFIVMSHFVPNKDIKTSEMTQSIRKFVEKHKLPYFFEAGKGGIEHALLPDEGYVVAGDVVVGADSHSCTYGGIHAFAAGIGSTDLAGAWVTGKIWMRVPETIKAAFHGIPKHPWTSAKDFVLHLIKEIGDDGATYQAIEYHGDAIENLTAEGKLTIANMAIEAGAKNAIFPFDKAIEAYEKGRARRPLNPVKVDPKAAFSRSFEWNVEDLEPQVSYPHLPSKAHPISKVMAEKIKVDQVFIGSCTNAKIEDLRIAAKILKGKKLAPWVRGVAIPASQKIYLEAIQEGIVEIFAKAGFAVTGGTCGPCLGGHYGIIGPGEVMLSTSNRNFVGRTGHPKGMTYLCNPAVAAASAVVGYIVDPCEVMGK
ncbi:MAG: 3-isopropylmalate dehydratase large subunit [Candidatus Auribacter fodinae]|uniref:3-isopropylmalate dehydratase large subunit n=1 Tax=Candidatus Auribacter fodinae TaxID=2093366 RepID=A0A3A4R0B3_9BACT|nr:MAG: 3-isopropylmalate dehydratase large subunit [Candidatus Auribacter fodinae]